MFTPAIVTLLSLALKFQYPLHSYDTVTRVELQIVTQTIKKTHSELLSNSYLKHPTSGKPFKTLGPMYDYMRDDRNMIAPFSGYANELPAISENKKEAIGKLSTLYSILTFVFVFLTLAMILTPTVVLGEDVRSKPYFSWHSFCYGMLPFVFFVMVMLAMKWMHIRRIQNDLTLLDAKMMKKQVAYFKALTDTHDKRCYM